MVNELAETRVLVVDNPSEVRNTREMLRQLNFNNISEMTSGLQVLTEIKKNPPGLVIVNFILPQYSGLQVFKSMRSDKSLAVIKFIMVVPKLNRREMEDLKNQGVEHILVRPFDSEKLRDTIYDAFGIKVGDVKETAAALYKEGMESFNHKKWEDALKKFRQANDSFQAPAHFFMQGRAYLEMAMNDHALAAFQNALAKGAPRAEVEHWMAIANQKKKDYETSVKALEQAAFKADAGASAHLELGKGYLNVDMVEKAGEAFANAVKMEPGNIAQRTEIGNAYLDKGLYSHAEQVFGEAIDISPDQINLYNRMAMALRKQAKYAEAINIYIKALKVAPGDEGLFYNLARALFESGQKDRAVKALEKAISLDPEFTEAITLKNEYLAAH
ncbi:MAG: tetratricopeptide repeat protein [Nitrospinae bacterium]|nr:tetratricopeptide repeat protein [Nitrospinota bacterium]